MARGNKKENTLMPEEKLAQAVIPVWEYPYKVPINWKWVTLGNLVNIRRGASPRPIKSYITEDEDGVNWIKIGDTNSGKYITHIAERITADGAKKSVYVEKGTLLLSNSMSFGRPYILKVNGCIHDGWLAITPSPVLNKEYLYYALLASEWYFEQVAVGAAVRNLNSERVAGTPIPCPPVAEQQRIVTRIEYMFSKLDEAKEKAQSVLDSFEARKAAIVHKAFTGELTAKWRKGHGEKLDSWSQGCLRDFCEVNPKKAVTKELSDDLDVSFVPMPALSDALGEITDPQVRNLKEVRTGFTNFSEGDVVFAKITPCMENGKSAVVGPLVNDIGFGSTEFYVLRCSKKLFNRYLYHLVRSRNFRAEAKSVMTGAVGQQRVLKSFLEDYPIRVPSVPEQIEIVRILDSLFSKEQQAKEVAEAVLDKIDLLKKSILARAFRGELGTNDPAEESAIGLLKVVLNTEKKVSPRQKAKSLPRELKRELRSNLEEKIVKLFFQKDTVDISMEEIMLVSSQTFEVIESLRELERRNILKKQNSGHYKLMR